jgi:hypothetical protein
VNLLGRWDDYHPNDPERHPDRDNPTVLIIISHRTQSMYICICNQVHGLYVGG